MKSISTPLKRFVEDLDEGAILKIEKRLKPGQKSRRMLQKDETLEQVIKKDEEIMKNLGATYDQIADGLELIIGLASQHQDFVNMEMEKGGPIDTSLVIIQDKKFEVTLTSVGGAYDCPFRIGKMTEPDGSCFYHDCGLEQNLALLVHIRNVETGHTFECLNPVHSIRDHHFFWGDLGTRLSPGDFWDVLGGPLPKAIPMMEKQWDLLGHTNIVDQQFIDQNKEFSSIHKVIGKNHYYIQSPEDRMRELSYVMEEQIKDEDDPVIIASLKTRYKNLQQGINPEIYSRMIFIAFDTEDCGIMDIEGAKLRIPKFEHLAYYFTKIDYSCFAYEKYDTTSITCKVE
jgi:hypothetical protein